MIEFSPVNFGGTVQSLYLTLQIGISNLIWPGPTKFFTMQEALTVPLFMPRYLLLMISI